MADHRRHPFRQADITRALRAARSAGLEVSSIEIDPVTGRINMKFTNTVTGEKTTGTPLDEWLEAHAS